MADHNDPMTRMEDDYDEGRRYSVARGIVVTVISVLILGVFVAGVTIAYQLGLEAGSSKVTPIIRADTGPTKVRPSEPGGMKIPNQDKTVYGQLGKTNGQTKDEKLLPTAERPIESLLLTIKPATAPTSKDEAPPSKQEKSAIQGGPVGATAMAPPVKLPPPPPPEKPVPKRPQGAEITKPKAPGKSVVATAVPPPPPPPPVASTPSRAKTAKPTQNKTAKPAKKTTRVASVDTTVKKKKPAGAYAVQLASAKSAKGARRTWGKLRKAHPTLLKGLSESVVKKNLGKKGTWYRLMAGSFPSAKAARAFCARAKKRKVGCLATRR